MRKFMYIGCVLGVFIACSNELDQRPISSATSLTFYASSQDFLQGISAAYSNLRSYPNRLINLSETRSDNLYAVSVGGVRDWEGINSFHKTIASNPYISAAWADNFNGIFKANIVLEQLVENGSVIPSEELRLRMEGEARFLRAFYYFDLLRYFGELPVVDRTLTAAEAVTVPRSPVADVYQLIIDDLRFAGTHLDGNYTDNDKGRATKFAAKGLLALVYMTRSGPTNEMEGPGMGLDEWDLAIELLNEIIDSPYYGFAESYEDVFSYANEGNPEVIFDIQYMSGVSPSLGGSFIGLLVPDSYFQSLGVVVSGASNMRPVSDDLLELYEPIDVRKVFSVQSGYVFNGEPEHRSFFKKYLDINRIPSVLTDWPINFIVMRYTDILLMKAECVLHGTPGSRTDDVDAVVNQVRRRAGLTTPLTGVTLEQLMNERRMEFASEGLRWHDLVRSGMVEEAMTAWINEVDIQDQVQPFQKAYIIYPVPQSELDASPGLYHQNVGY